MDRARPLLALLYWGVLARLGRSIVNEDWDGIKSVSNALLVWGGAGTFAGFDGKRPPVGWLLASPVLSAAYRAGGPEAALRACRYLMPVFLVALLWVSHALFARRFSAFAAALTVLLMALNPMLIQFAPFALFDIFSALAVLPFLWAAYHYLSRPDARSLAVLAACYLLAFLSKYHLGMMILVPLAFLLVEPAGRRRFFLSPLWLLPGLCWGASAGFLGALIFWITGGDRHAWSQGWTELWANFSFNVLVSKASHWYLYLEAFARQLGPGLAGLALAGVWVWLRGRRPGDLYLALSLAVPLLALSFGIANKEARYAIPLLPLVYAAIAQGLDFALERLPPGPRSRHLLLAGSLLLVPWSESLAAARYLLHEPSVHSRLPWELARLVGSEVPPSGCVAWLEGDIAIPAATPLYRYEWSLILGAPTFGFFAQRKVVEVRDIPAGEVCGLLVVPRLGPKGERWSGGAAARVYRAPSVLAAEVYSDHVQERASR